MSPNVLKAKLRTLNERGAGTVQFAATEWVVKKQHVSGDSVAIIEKKGTFRDEAVASVPAAGRLQNVEADVAPDTFCECGIRQSSTP